jgi:hypothetical protein
MILQMVRNEHVRFGGHVDIEVRYKIFQLDVLRKTQILHNLSCFEAILMKNTPRTLGVKDHRFPTVSLKLYCENRA